MPTSLKGKLLVASPALKDPNFQRSVVLMCQHDEEGAVGLIVNRPTEILAREALTEIPGARARDETIWQGGPVQRDSVAILHADPAAGGEPVVPGVWFGAEMGLLTALFTRDDHAVRFRLFAGYAGWGAGQLEDELKQGAWIVAPADADRAFTSSPKGEWSAVLRALGGRFAVMALTPESPELN